MRISPALVWSVAIGIVLSAVAWGKTQADVSWMKESNERIEVQVLELTKRIYSLQQQGGN